MLGISYYPSVKLLIKIVFLLLWKKCFVRKHLGADEELVRVTDAPISRLKQTLKREFRLNVLNQELFTRFPGPLCF